MERRYEAAFSNMSMRNQFCSLTSIGPVRACVASGNEAVVEAIMRAHMRDNYPGAAETEDDPEFRRNAESIIMCDAPPRKEPGCWFHLIEYLADHLGLSPNDDLPINEGWKHSQVWLPYRKMVKRHVSRSSRRSLAHIDYGRPLRGKAIQYDGCLFSWLTASEVRELGESLSKMDSSVITDLDLIDFHEALVESLQMIACQSRELFTGA